MKKRIVLGVVVVSIFVLSVAALLIFNEFSILQTQIAELQAQNSELHNQNSDLQNETVELQDQNRRLQDQIGQLLEQLGEDYKSPVEIIAFQWEDGFNPYGGVTLANRVNVTVQNKGAHDVSGLTLVVRLVYNGTELNTYTGFTKQIDILHAGESLKISDTVFHVVGYTPSGTECVGTLMLGGFVLDERTDTIVWD